MKNIIIGIIFALLWASAAVATKFGVAVAHPLVLANFRFFIAGLVLLGFSFFTKKNNENRLPKGKEWLHLSIFGLLNTTLYLGFYVYALKYASAGISSLAVTLNPLLIVLFSGWIIGRKASFKEWLAIIIGFFGVAVACFPLLIDGHTSFLGLLLLTISMIIVSFASIYYAKVPWKLSNILINGWQVTIGGLFLLPLTLALGKINHISYNSQFIYSVLWLSLGVSVIGLICWFYLLRKDTVKASLWLFLCPVFGFFYAWLLLNEPITWHTYLGTFLVIIALYISQKRK